MSDTNGIPDGNRIADDEISLLDLLVTVAEHWMLLVIVPFLVGIAAYGFASLQPATWRSSAVIGLPQAEVSNYLQTMFDDETGVFAGVGAPASEIERELTISQGSTAERTRIELNLAAPRMVEHALETVLAQLAAAVERGEVVSPEAQVEAEMAELDEEIALRERMIGTLTRIMEEDETAVPFDGTAYALTVSTLNEIMGARDEQRKRRTVLESGLAALPVTVVEQEASSAIRVGQAPLTIALLAFLGSGLVLLILVFVRAGVKNAAADPETRSKLDRIRRAFWLAPRPPVS